MVYLLFAYGLPILLLFGLVCWLTIGVLEGAPIVDECECADNDLHDYYCPVVTIDDAQELADYIRKMENENNKG